MFTSRKVFWVVFGLYTLIVFLPGAFGSSDVAPPHSVDAALFGCACFVIGVYVGSLVFPFADATHVPIDPGAIRRGFVVSVRVLVILALGVLLAGPTPPLIEALSEPDSLAIALLREDAVKLNANETFVRLYSWGRDIFAPIVFALAIEVLRRSPGTSLKVYACLGLLAAVFIGLWSGQKATIVNYLVAAFIFASRSPAAMARQLLAAVPIVGLLIVFTFAVTQPDLFTAGAESAVVLEVFLTSIFNRILSVPLEVAAVFIHSLDDLRIIHSLDAVPYLSSLWTPGILSIENRVAIEFYHQGIDSGHSNALAFAYAYVLGGYVGCVVGGIASMAVMKASVELARATRSPFLFAAFSAFACYLLLDLLNGNFVQYLIKLLAFAVIVWLVGRLLRAGRTLYPARRVSSAA